MDPRVAKHASIVADWSCELEPAQTVVIEFEEGGKPLADALVTEVAKRGAQPLLVASSATANRGFLTHAADDVVGTLPVHLDALIDATDVFIFVIAGENTRALSDVPSGRVQARARALEPIREKRLSKTWCLTMHPTAALAQEAGMSTEAFADLYYKATLIDWPQFAARVELVAERLEGTSEVHLVAPDTDLYLPVKERPWVASTGKRNLPSGEVFTAPHETRVEGHVVLDLPAVIHGQEVRGVRLAFEKGELVDWSAERGDEALRTLLDTDDGARRLGELGIGMNRGIDRPTRNILLDEKMGGTIHLALGRAYKENHGVNESAVHQDLIKTMGPDSYIAADGNVLQRDGVFWFEKGFARGRR